MKQNIRTLAAIMICGIALAACSDKDNDDNTNIVNNPDPANVETVCTPSLPQSCTLTITATKGNDASLSKALSLTNDDKTLNASWKQDEKVAVYNGDTKIGELTAESDGASTTLSGDNLSPAPSAGNTLTLKFDETDYSGQDGTLATIASTYDYATATVTVKSVSADGNITIEESAANFENQQAIVKFTLSSDGTAINATSLKVNDLTVNLASAKSEVFVAIPAAEAKNINLTVDNGTDKYVYYKAGANFANGKYYAINVKNLAKATDLASITENTVIPDGAVLTGTLLVNKKISIADDATVTLNNVTIEGENNKSYNWAGITCDGDATIILEGDNTVKGFYFFYPGIYIAKGYTLTIDGTGKLNASSNVNESNDGFGAGIGGGNEISCGNIIISGGTITATGGTYYGAGIGCGINATCGDITINGGTVTATGGESGAGIGCGSDVTCGDITISGGTITATGGENGAGIGSSSGTISGSTCGNITISGGSVTAIGGENGAGIGSGYYNSTCNAITISGGTVTATGGEDGAGIGSGYYNSTCGDITINGGTVTATGGNYAAGIGSGDNNSTCGDITISAGVEQVTATKGKNAANSIGAGEDSECGTVNIEAPGKVIQN